MTFALRAQGIRKSFGGVEVLHGVDLDAIGGSVLALLGENGAGKTTLVKIIAGDYTADDGDDPRRRGRRTRRSPRSTPRTWASRSSSRSSRTRPTLTVAENISMGRLPNRFGLVNWGEVNRRAKQDPRRARRGHPPGRRGVHAPRRRAPDRRDRPRAVAQGPAAHPRRADRRAVPPRGGAPVRVHPPAARPGRRDHLHHPSAGRGVPRSPTASRCCATAPSPCYAEVKDTDRAVAHRGDGRTPPHGAAATRRRRGGRRGAARHPLDGRRLE